MFGICCFADDFALLSLNKSGLQLDRFPDACLNAGMKNSTAKTEIICMSRHLVQCPFQTNGVTLQQTEKFNTFGAEGGRFIALRMRSRSLFAVTNLPSLGNFPTLKK